MITILTISLVAFNALIIVGGVWVVRKTLEQRDEEGAEEIFREANRQLGRSNEDNPH